MESVPMYRVAFLVLEQLADCCGYVIVDKPLTGVSTIFNPKHLILTNYVPGQKDITGCNGKYCCL